MKRPSRTLLIALLLTLFATGLVIAQDDGDQPRFPSPDPDRPTGLTIATDAAGDGYLLVSVVQSMDTLLLARDGRIVHVWPGDYYPGNTVYLLPDGDLLRTASLPGNPIANGGQWGAANGRLERVNWDGEVVWSFEYMTDNHMGHHDIEPLPNGHILMLLYERFSADQALAAGLDPALLPEDQPEIWSEFLLEIDPATNTIVWEWHVWDHLVQDYDPNLPNYGAVAEHPERINLNYRDPAVQRSADWIHANAVDYNSALDQIMLTTPFYSEIWIIDHAISTEEGRGPAGDLLFRWGNPAAHDAGTESNHALYGPHNGQWIAEGLPGAGNVLIFNNGRPDQHPYSSIIEIALPLTEDGTYRMNPSEYTRLREFVWEFVADPPTSFYSPFISGAQRQPNGNTLIAEGMHGRIFEVTPAGDIVWEYYLPPAAWVFRAESYDLLGLDVDLSGDHTFTGGAIWGMDCADGTRPRLYEYLPQQAPVMAEYRQLHGDAAQDVWKMEACAAHGGRVE